MEEVNYIHSSNCSCKECKYWEKEQKESKKIWKKYDKYLNHILKQNRLKNKNERS